jgi:hypothetical protein
VTVSILTLSLPDANWQFKVSGQLVATAPRPSKIIMGFLPGDYVTEVSSPANSVPVTAKFNVTDLAVTFDPTNTLTVKPLQPQELADLAKQVPPIVPNPVVPPVVIPPGQVS